MIGRTPDLDDLDREIRDHIDAETEDNLARGMAPGDARAAAIRKFGNVTRVKEDVRGVWVPDWIDQLRQDARDAGRRLRRNPGFSAIVILTLAMGIGLTTAVFSVVNAVLVRSLPVPDPDRLVWLTMHEPVADMEMFLSLEFVEWKAQAPSLETAVAYSFGDSGFAAVDETVRTRVVSVTDGFWDVVGARLALGRFPLPNDQRPLVVSHQFFVHRLSGDHDVIGRPVTLDGEQATIVGVLEADSVARLPFPSWRYGLSRREAEIFRPLELRPNPYPAGQRNVLAIGKLKPGATLAALQAEAEAIHTRLVSGAGLPWTRLQPRVRPLQEEIVGGSRVALTLLLGAALLVLVITCANVANLLLARLSARQREMALRMSVGGGPLRILRQLLFESAMFASLGGLAGAGLSYGLLATVRWGMPDAIPRMSEVSVDVPVLAFAAGISLVAALLFGLWPAVMMIRIDVQSVLKSGSRHVSAPRSTIRAGRLVVAMQLAMTLVLLAGAGLMLKSVWRMTSHPPGFEPARILTMRVDFRGTAYRDPARRQAYAVSALNSVAAIGGVRDVAFTSGGDSSALMIEEGKPEDRSRPPATINSVSPGFPQMLGMQLLRGRWLADQEPGGAILINDTLARTQFAGVDPIGRRLRMAPAGKVVFVPIVGVVADMTHSKIDAEPGPEVFVHYSYAPMFGITIAARADGDPLVFATQARAAVAAVDRTQAVYDVQTMAQALTKSIAPRLFNTILLMSFAGVALFLAIVGLYGVVAYTVAARTSEIGIRMALGAHRSHVVRMIVLDGMTSTGAGVVMGLGAAYGLARLLTDLLYGVAATDASTFAVVTTVLMAIAFVGCVLPALKAALVDPVIALRAE
jgi:putative ABC transport system permease protein